LARKRGILFASIALLVALSGCTTWVRGPDLAREYYNIGNAFYDLGRFDRAAEYYQRALSLDPRLTPAGFNLARVYADKGRYADATGVLLDLLTGDPDNVLLRETLAYVHYLADEPDRAIARYTEVLALSPFNVNALYNLGRIAEQQSRNDDAIDYYRRASLADPNDAALVFSYGRRLIEVDAERGAVVLERFLDMQPADRDRLVATGDSLRRERYFLPARRAYQKVLERSAVDAEALFGMASVLLIGVQDGQAGIERLREALDAGYDNPEEFIALLSARDLADPQAVRLLLDQKGVLPADAAGP
jgi:tetratricopeptide (TPR) repeat protein